MMKEKVLPRNEAGIRATLMEMRSLARNGIRDVHGPVSFPRALDLWLRERWRFVPEDVETIRSPGRMMQDRVMYGKFMGDCDDAAVLAAAMLFRTHLSTSEVRGACFLAVRPPKSTHFEHVFVRAVDSNGVFRVDPTAPLGADYSLWEEMRVEVF